MITLIGAGLLLAVAQGYDTDTTVAVQRGTRLEISRLGGGITITTWERDAMRVRADQARADGIEVRVTGDVATLSARAERGRPSYMVEYNLTVPVWMDLNLSSTYGDVVIRGARGRVVVETVEGDVIVDGGRGVVSLESVEGEVQLSGATGEIELSSVEGDIQARDLEGRVAAETVDGNITLAAVRSADVTATTVDGDIEYDGSLADNGRYRFVTHDGDLMLWVPERVNATVAVATFDGTFESDFAVTLSETRRGKRFSFTLGSGAARIELESFDGDIRLLRR